LGQRALLRGRARALVRDEDALYEEIVARRIAVGASGLRRKRGDAARDDADDRPHPAAWSRMTTSNGCAPGGCTWNVRPHRPTMTRASDERAYTPGERSASR